MRQTDVLILGSTRNSAALRHELPLPLTMPGCYLEHDGDRYGLFDELDRLHFDGAPTVQFTALQDMGYDSVADRVGPRGALLECVARACEQIGVRDAITPPDFPLDAADFLRNRGIALAPDRAIFEMRRRRKTEPEIAGIRRAQRSAERAMAEVRAALRAGERSCEALQSLVAMSFARSGMEFDNMVIAHGAQTGTPLDFGSGWIDEGEPIIVDLWPRDRVSGCHADMSRTFCLGEAPPELARMHRACLEVAREVERRVRPGVRTGELAAAACDLFEDYGFRTFRDAAKGERVQEGAIHLISHGVGLDIIEEPFVWLGDTEIVAGDVFSVEPGLYRPGWGGCRIEDLVHVVDDGVELLTSFDYELEIGR